MRINDLENKLVIIFGAGREGQATFEVLKRKLVQAEIIMYDDAMEGAQKLASELIDRTNDRTVVIRSPGIPPNNLLYRQFLDRGAQSTTPTNLFMNERKGRGRLIGITGTKGKSTTSSLLAHVLQVADLPVRLVGNIGVPALSEIDAPDETIFVLEMSSYQLMDLDTGPDIAIFLNIFDEHMDFHGSAEAYRSAKANITMRQGSGDTFIYNERFTELCDLATKSSAQSIGVSLHDDAAFETLKLVGQHNKENACAVLAVTQFLYIPHDKIVEAFSTFKPLPHRLEDIGTFNGITFINDSISTTPQSALAAIDVFGDKLSSIILGGKDRGYDFAELAKRSSLIANLTIYIMPGGERITEALRALGLKPRPVQDLAEAVNDVFANAPQDSVCLLSPASPSYGQFKNFEVRGEKFRQAVMSHSGLLV